MGEEGDKSQEDYTSFLRTEDVITLSSTTTNTAGASHNGERVCLAAEGFGNRMCFLQSMANKELPFDISVCGFVLEQALSVRALQEMVSAKSSETTGQSGHRTLLYGHAVLLRHSHSNMYLSCLSTQSSSSDKLAFDVGLTVTPEGESCWWTIHPASKQRSEGEKVRVGDDLILVSVASERYLHIGAGALVIASFQQTIWTVQPVSSGAVRQKSLGYVFGGEVLRIMHGDECVTIPPRDTENVTNTVMYETGAVTSHARSLWKLEHVRTKWAEGFIGWGQPCRLRHVTSGRYLACTEDNNVVTFHRTVATEDASAFLLRQSKDDRKFSEAREDEGMGTADIKYGDSLVYVQHMKTGLWLSYQTFETKKRGVGRVEMKKAVVMVEGHMDDGLTMSRAQEEEDKSARVIRKCTSLISRFVKALESLKTEGRNSRLWENISLAEVIKTLEDLIEYFAPPGDELEFEERQVRLKALRNRQDLFQEEGMIALILETIDHCSQWKSMRHLAHLIGEDSAAKWNDMISYLYLLLAAFIKGSRRNCCQFASSTRLNWLVDRLEEQGSPRGVLDVLHCVLIDSPEALNVIKEQHIRTIISLIDKHGRDPKVLDVLCSLCVGNDVAVRSNQNLICENLLPGRDLLLQTRVVDHVYSMSPNIFVGRCDGSAMYQMWYYEAIVDHIDQVTHLPVHCRIGWANTNGYVPYPGGGTGWGCNGVGDDLFSYAFDGMHLWTGGKPRRVRQNNIQKGDTIGVLLDLSVPQITFTVNGNRVAGFFRDFNTDGMFYPVISMSAKLSIRFMLGGEHGKMRFGPPEGFSPAFESLLPKEKLRLTPCFAFGDVPRGMIIGPAEVRDHTAFVPRPVETQHVQLPSYIESVREKLAENIHELWAMGKIDQGWMYGDRRDDYNKYHPCLTTFEKLPPNERSYNISLSHETLRTLLALGYHITYDPQYTQNTRLKTIKLSANYMQSNGYKPAPLDLSSIVLSNKMMDVVELLAENTHNVWARERIKQGWTYGLNEDVFNKRSPHLVPYGKVDANIKKANRDTASETVRTLMSYGYSLEPPTNEAGETTTKDSYIASKQPQRLYRAEKTYAVSSGKWYYEFEVVTTGYMKVGWAKADMGPGVELGYEGYSYCFDGQSGRKWNQGSEQYGKVWQKGDVIGCMLDITDKTISFSLNGELMMDRMGQEIAFKGIDVDCQYVPALCLGAGQRAKINFGQDVNSLKFFTCCGLQEGYEPFCVNMTRQMTLWYSKDQPLFEPLNADHPRLEMTKVPGGTASPPTIKLNSKTYGTLERVMLEYVRLSMPVRFNTQFVSPRDKMTYEQRMNVENVHKSETGGKGLFKRKADKKRAQDDTMVDDMRGGGHKLRRQSSDTNLAVPQGGAKFMDVAKAINIQRTQADPKQSKSPFSLFGKKSKSREPSPGMRGAGKGGMAISGSEYEYSESEESYGDPKALKKTLSEASYASEGMESEGEFMDLEANMDIIDEYYYGVRIFPGQDPNQVYVGWVTPQFHEAKPEFDMKDVRNVVVCQLDQDNQLRASVSRKNCYIVSAGDLQHRYSHHEDQGKRMTPGLLIGCHVDTSTGLLSFTVNGKEVANKFQVEPGAMLFPAVFFEPTNKEVLQIELGRTKTALPLSAVLFRSGKHVIPQCPPRLDVQISKPCHWSRVPMMATKVHTLKLSDIRGWSMLCEEAIPMMALYVPEEDRCLDINELIEYEELLRFHAHTLHLYQAVCSHGNHRVAHELTHHVDEKQLMYCIKSKYMPGPLRMGLHELMVAIHLAAHSAARLMTQNEYIIPLSFDSESFSLYRDDVADDSTKAIREGIPLMGKSVSIRTKISMDPPPDLESQLAPPYFPLPVLKELMMQLLTDAVDRGGAHIRDPIGGSNENLFVPLLKVVDSLLVMGLLDDNDLAHLLILIDPTRFDPTYDREASEEGAPVSAQEGPTSPSVEGVFTVVNNRKHGLLQIKLSEPVKLQMALLLHHICDLQTRHRVESIVAFSDSFVKECQDDQLRRYIEIKQTDMPMAVAARKTREFRCPPQEQMRSMLAFRPADLENENENAMDCSTSEKLRGDLQDFHDNLLRHANHPPPEPEPEPEQKPMSIGERLLALVASAEEKKEESSDEIIDNFQKLIISTITQWAKTDFIADQGLIREMFALLHRQYDGVGEVLRCMEKAYVIKEASREDIGKLLASLGLVRSLIPVQASKDEEELLKTNIWDLADNKVFFQHPDLMRALGIHETVMQLMVNTLNKSQQQAAAAEAVDQAAKRRSSLASNVPDLQAEEAAKDSAADMVVACCRFLCYFCRTGRINQKAMFDHLSYLLENSCMLLSRPSLRGACPLDVACSSLMDNNELALALRESDLDKVAVYLSRCGQQSNQELIAHGYPDIGWDPVEGERFLDFLRFCVWVNGESVEENANLVVRLLIRRPECLGPALRGEGGGLLRAMQDGILMSLQIAASKDAESLRFLRAVTEEQDDDRGDFLTQCKYDYSLLPPEDDEDYIDMGGAILQFYSSLVDLLGRCAPDQATIEAGRSDSLRARAILRSLVSMEDLEGVLGLRFILPVGKSETIMSEDGEVETVVSAGLPSGLGPQHKAAIVLFLERVYGIENQQTFFRLLEEGFLPDMRAATTLESNSASESDMALALNRYLCTAVLPLLSTYSFYFNDADHVSGLLDQTLHTTYRLSKCRSLTKNQRDMVSDFLVALTGELRAPMITSLLRKLVVDVPALTENTVVPLRVLTNHYERCGRYYGSHGWGSHGQATEEEKRLTMMLFSGIFDSLAQRAYDPELFSKALPCLSAIGCALSPDYSLSHHDDLRRYQAEAMETYEPMPIDTSRVRMTDQLMQFVADFAEHYHDEWAMTKIDGGWTMGHLYDEGKKEHPNLRNFKTVNEPDKQRMMAPCDEAIRAMLAWGWSVETDPSRSNQRSQVKRKMSKLSLGDYSPRPVDLRGVTLTRAMLEQAEHLAENAHDVWAKRKKLELDHLGGGIHPQLVQYNVLTDKEKKKYRDRSQEILRFLQVHGFRVISGDLRSNQKREIQQRSSQESEADSGVGVNATEKRFAYSLLEKLLEYVDKASYNMKNVKPGTRFSRRHSFSTSTEDVKFFGKVVLPLVEKYFKAHKDYFITNVAVPQASGTASLKEKEMTTTLFSKLALLLRQKITAFGHDTQISVGCLQTLVQAIDARAVVRSSPEIIRSSLLPFLTFAADDLTQTVANLKVGRFSHVKGTITRGATSLNYVHMVLLPVLTSMFDHLSRNNFGSELLVGEQQLFCYRILNALYSLGTSSKSFVQRGSIMKELDRHRPALGECVASFASTFPVAFLEPHLNKYNKNSILFGIEDENIATHSLEAKEVMDEIAETIPGLDRIIAEIEELADSGGKYHEAPHVIEVTLPMLCSYLPFWWSQGPDNSDPAEGQCPSTVTADLMNSVLGNVLKLIKNNIGTEDAPWMNRIATRTQPIIVNATPEMLAEHILPVALKLKENARITEAAEEEYHHEKRRHAGGDIGDLEINMQNRFQNLVRDMYAFYPLLIKYVDLHRSSWLKNPIEEPEELYLCVASVFNLWSKSHLFKKEEQNFVFANEIDNMALIMPSQDKGSSPMDDDQSDDDRKGRKRAKARLEPTASLNVACLRRLLPIGLNMFGGREQELVQQAKQRLIEKESEGDIEDWLKISFQTEEKTDDDEAMLWQKSLYKKIGSKKDASKTDLDCIVERVLAMSKVLHGLHLVEHPADLGSAWKKLMSSSKKRAVMACFRMHPVYHMPRHRAVNLFLCSYKEQWLQTEEPGHGSLIEDITGRKDEEAEPSEDPEAVPAPQPLSQLITAFSRSATIETVEKLHSDFLYFSYANIMSGSCHGGDEEEGGDDEAGAQSLQEQEMEKQKLLFEQSRLADRGAAEMVLMYISASKGQWSDMVIATLDLGISILRGGNTDVQSKMLQHLKEKKDVGFFTSVSGLMQQCSALDLDAFERMLKAEGLGVSDTSKSGDNKNLGDAENTCKLFRFLQLLCEGHNLDFQNYLRTQAGNTTTVNMIICTVDYLLRLQESIMDFYWHYSGRDSIDPAGKESFLKAITVTAQIFASITEFIQGPCTGNQLALAHSRLWDAVGGFLYIFAHMQDKLSKDPEQLELLREFMGLQKEMMIMLLSMLEGNVVNGPIGKQMVDTLVESSANFEMILKFFDIFLKMKDLTSSDAFMEFDQNKDGIISLKEFRRALEAQKTYTNEEIEYIMMCVDSNQDGKVDFNEFTDRFHNPAKDIGFNVAVLLTNLSEHMPGDTRLERFLEKARCVLDYFEPYLGRIEIMGSAGRIERVYFEITQDHIDQWEKPQIKDSKRAFLHEAVHAEDSKEKLEFFVNFCEDTIFEMQHATSISAEEFETQFQPQPQQSSFASGITEHIKTGAGYMKDGLIYGLSCLSPSNIKAKYDIAKAMTWKELMVAFVHLNFNIFLTLLTFLFTVAWTFVRFIYMMMRGDSKLEKVKVTEAEPILISGERVLDITGEGGAVEAVRAEHGEPRGGRIEAFGLDISKQGETAEGGDFTVTPHLESRSSSEVSEEGSEEAAPLDEEGVPRPSSLAVGSQSGTPRASPSSPGKSALNAEVEEASEQKAADETTPEQMKESSAKFGKWVLGMLARNFYNFKLIALALAFLINFILLFYKVSELGMDEGGDAGDAAVEDAMAAEEGGEEEAEEFVDIDDNVSYLAPFLRFLALSHSFTALGIMVAYYHLKIPLVIFKREKEIARILEFDGMWVAEQPADDDLRGHWDKLVISTKTWPDNYWDKFVKKKVRNKYAEQYEYDQITQLLGMDKDVTEKKKSLLLPEFMSDLEWQYVIWKWGVIITDNNFQYILFYLTMSLLGNINYFFFAAHLIDIAVCFKTLGTILQSVTHNGKQLVLTVLLTSIVVYMYTVLAFNFFRKFYNKGEDGEDDYKCHDMLSCYVFHLYVGVRAGGGIGDEIEAPDGDPNEVYRILFDITFFFFVIVILLAIIQGLIIDAFGELRGQLEQVREDLESSCFICGIGKDYFDNVPHGFEIHVKNEHNFANYMFFLMHLINKPDTEYTGQETYVWELYQQRSWDFFPVGECFRKQYENELGGG